MKKKYSLHQMRHSHYNYANCQWLCLNKKIINSLKNSVTFVIISLPYNNMPKGAFFNGEKNGGGGGMGEGGG